MKRQRIFKRLLSLLMVCALLWSVSAAAFAWESPPDLYGGANVAFDLDGMIMTEGGYVVSADDIAWQHSISLREAMEKNVPVQPGVVSPMTASMFTCHLPAVSLDPGSVLQYQNYWQDILWNSSTQAYYAQLPVTACMPGTSETEILAQRMGGGMFLRCGVFFLQPDIWQSYAADMQSGGSTLQTLNIEFFCAQLQNSGLHVLLDLQYLKNAVQAGDPAMAGMQTIPDWVVLGQPYRPLLVNDASGTWQDTNGNGVCDDTETGSDLRLGAWVCASGSFSLNLTLSNPLMRIPVPILIWNEGQTEMVGQPLTGSPALSMAAHVWDNERIASPLAFAGDSMAASPKALLGMTDRLVDWGYNTGFVDSSTLLQLKNDSGFLYDEPNGILFLPDNIDGAHVEHVDNGLFCGGQEMINYGMQPNITTLVVPDGVFQITDRRQIGTSRFIPSLQRLHLPAGVMFESMYGLAIPQTATVCSSTYDPALAQYCASMNVAYEVCAGHIPLHTHSFDNGVVTPPSYHGDGYTTFTCTGCSGSYPAQFVPKLATPTLTLQGGSAEPNDTVAVTVSLNDNSGLDDMTLIPWYDAQTMTLESVSAAQGLTATVVPRAGSAAPARVKLTAGSCYTGAALCTLVFRLAADAAQGSKTVWVSSALTPPASHVDVTSLSLVDAQTSVTVLPASQPPAPVLHGTAGSGTPGSLVPVTVRLDNNPGLIALTMEIAYDPTALALEGADDLGLFGTGTANEPIFIRNDQWTDMPFRVIWSDDLAQQNHTSDGDLVTFWFRVLPGANANTTVTVTTIPAGTFDADLQTVSVGAGTAQITVTAAPGDIDGNGELDATDVMWLAWYLEDPTSVPAVAVMNLDVNGDGVVDLADKTYLKKMLVGGYAI